jgi:biopolymer transport protein TolR
MEHMRKRRLMGEINVVPYIDVMLVLLIIFMVTAPMLSQGIKVELPDAGAEPLEPDLQKMDPLILSVDAAGSFYISVGDDKDKPQDATRILKLAQIVLKKNPETPVLVKADERVEYGRVISGMVLLQRAGARKIGFLTDPAQFDPIENQE